MRALCAAGGALVSDGVRFCVVCFFVCCGGFLFWFVWGFSVLILVCGVLFFFFGVLSVWGWLCVWWGLWVFFLWFRVWVCGGLGGGVVGFWVLHFRLVWM